MFCYNIHSTFIISFISVVTEFTKYKKKTLLEDYKRQLWQMFAEKDKIFWEDSIKEFAEKYLKRRGGMANTIHLTDY